MRKNSKKKPKISSTTEVFRPVDAPESDYSLFTEGRSGTRRAKKLTPLSARENLSHDVDILAMDRAINYPSFTVNSFLEQTGFDKRQRDRFYEIMPASDWDHAIEKVLNNITENMVKRHVDLLAETNETHIKASKLTMARAIEMLTKLQVQPPLDKNGKPVKGARYLRSVDLSNCAGAIKSAQEIYRRAMGIGNDDGGIQQIVEKIAQMQGHAQTNIQINNIAGTQTPLEVALHQMDYDQIAELIEMKRTRGTPTDIEGQSIEELEGEVIPAATAQLVSPT